MGKKKGRESDRRSDQGGMDDLATERVMRTTKREVDRITGQGRRGVRKTGRMVRFANRVEDALRRNDALPSRESDCSLIGDLAELELRVARLQHALKNLVAGSRAKAARESFENRLVQLTSEIDAVRAVVRDVNAPMRRLLRRRCGNVGLAVAALVGATATLD